MYRLAAAVVVWLVLWLVPAAGALEPGQVAILCNRDDPASIDLAEEYARKRGVPVGNILAVPLPAEERISFETYFNDVAPAVRQALADRGLVGKVTCVVSVKGVPLRVEDRRPDQQADDEERRETVRLREQAMMDLSAAVADAETLARDAGAELPEQGPPADPPAALDRLQASAKALQAMIADVPAADRPAVEAAWRAVNEKLGQPVVPEGWDLPEIDEATARAAATRPADAAARATIRAAARRQGPVVTLAVLARHEAMIAAGKGSGSCFDSELALVLWPAYDPARWLVNPLSYRSQSQTPPVLMTSRLDAPTAEVVRRMIDDALAAERDGLAGKVVIDTRGLDAAGPDGIDQYGVYDETLRQLALALRDRLPADELVFDAGPGLLPEPADDIAIYAGWYSVKKYVRPGTFVPGAVALHVASYEMLTLRDEAFPGWVPNLLADGAAASVGPVAEPYLTAFPRAHDFFLLLMSGELTLAEAYWATCPMVSWQMGLVGDPLYRPYAARPLVPADELPEHLRPIIEAARAAKAAAAEKNLGEPGGGS